MSSFLHTRRIELINAIITANPTLYGYLNTQPFATQISSNYQTFPNDFLEFLHQSIIIFNEYHSQVMKDDPQYGSKYKQFQLQYQYCYQVLAQQQQQQQQQYFQEMQNNQYQNYQQQGYNTANIFPRPRYGHKHRHHHEEKRRHKNHSRDHHRDHHSGLKDHKDHHHNRQRNHREQHQYLTKQKDCYWKRYQKHSQLQNFSKSNLVEQFSKNHREQPKIYNFPIYMNQNYNTSIFSEISKNMPQYTKESCVLFNYQPSKLKVEQKISRFSLRQIRQFINKWQDSDKKFVDRELIQKINKVNSWIKGQSIFQQQNLQQAKQVETDQQVQQQFTKLQINEVQIFEEGRMKEYKNYIDEVIVELSKDKRFRQKYVSRILLIIVSNEQLMKYLVDGMIDYGFQCQQQEIRVLIIKLLSKILKQLRQTDNKLNNNSNKELNENNKDKDDSNNKYNNEYNKDNNVNNKDLKVNNNEDEINTNDKQMNDQMSNIIENRDRQMNNKSRQMMTKQYKKYIRLKVQYMFKMLLQQIPKYKHQSLLKQSHSINPQSNINNYQSNIINSQSNTNNFKSSIINNKSNPNNYKLKLFNIVHLISNLINQKLFNKHIIKLTIQNLILTFLNQYYQYKKKQNKYNLNYYIYYQSILYFIHHLGPSFQTIDPINKNKYINTNNKHIIKTKQQTNSLFHSLYIKVINLIQMNTQPYQQELQEFDHITANDIFTLLILLDYKIIRKSFPSITYKLIQLRQIRQKNWNGLSTFDQQSFKINQYQQMFNQLVKKSLQQYQKGQQKTLNSILSSYSQFEYLAQYFKQLPNCNRSQIAKRVSLIRKILQMKPTLSNVKCGWFQAIQYWAYQYQQQPQSIQIFSKVLSEIIISFNQPRQCFKLISSQQRVNQFFQKIFIYDTLIFFAN